MRPSLSLETRVLRLGGIALVVLAACVLFVFQAIIEERPDFEEPPSTILALAGLLALAVNLLAAGFVLLAAGVRELSLVRSSRARRGALARMAAANLLLVCAAALAAEDIDAIERAGLSEWLLLPGMAGFMLAARTGIRMFRRGWRYEAASAEEALARDPRSPVVYLRPFSVDDEMVVSPSGRFARIVRLLQITASISPEQELAWILDRIGPVVAIGKPGERLPELGAARMYVGNDEWRDVVGTLLGRAALVVVRAGETPNVWWELEQAMLRCPPERVVVVALEPPERSTVFERRFAAAFGEPARAPAPRRSPITRLIHALFPFGKATGKVIYFDADRTAHEQPILLAPSAYGLAVSGFSPHGAGLRTAFRAVFAARGLPWTSRRTLLGAVLLALFGGVFGLHLFYMGDRRRGWWRCAWSWTGVPVVLGVIDAVRLALLDEAAFQARVGSGLAIGRSIAAAREVS